MINERRIPIPQGNDFTLRLKVQLTDGTTIPANALTDIEATAGIFKNQLPVAVATDNEYLYISFPEDQKLGAYDVHVTAKNGDRNIAAHYKELFVRVPFGQAVPVEYLDDDFIMIGMTDAEIERLRASLTKSIQMANQAREDYNMLYERTANVLYNQVPTIYDAALQADATKQAAEAAKTAAEAAKAAAEAIDVPADVASSTNVRQAKVEILEAIDQIQVDVPADIARKGDVEAVTDHLDNITDLQIGKVQDGIGNLQDQMSETIGRDADGVTLHQKADAFAQELDTIKNLLTITQAEVTDLLNA